jgi:chain length determinant protein (polysaccharide antigen chain regulator)
VNSPNSTPPYTENTDFDFFDLVQDIWRQKWLIIGVTVIVTILAVSYAFIATPIYQAEARVEPPRPADIALINLGREQAGIEEMDVEESYSIFTRNLTSQSVRRWFFEEHFLSYLVERGISGSRGRLLRQMNDVIIVSVPDMRQSPDSYVIEANVSVPERASEFVNRFVEEVSRRSLVDLEMNTLDQINNKRKALEEHIEALRSSAKVKRVDRLARLQEALNIAEAIGLETPEITGGRTQVLVGSAESAQMFDDNMLFLNGSKAIRAELSLLQAREDDDPFISELRALQQEMALLKSVDHLPSGVRLFTLDSAGETPDDPIRPNRAIIIVLGATVGVMLGGLIALIRVARSRRSKG